MKIGLALVILGIGCASMLFVLIGGILTLVRARKDGILKLCFPGKVLLIAYLLVLICHGEVVLSSASYVHEVRQVLAEAQTVGADAFRRAENDSISIILDEGRYIELKTVQYQEKADKYQGKAYGYLGAFLCYGCCLMLLCGFVTKKGWYALTTLKPCRLLPEERNGELLFFTERSAGTDKPLLRVKDTPENREKFAALLDKDETNEKENTICSA